MAYIAPSDLVGSGADPQLRGCSGHWAEPAECPLSADIVDLVGNWRAALWSGGCFTALELSARHSWGVVVAYVVAGRIWAAARL
jgi:hypothetical protein